MKSLFETTIRTPLIVLLLIVSSALIAKAQDTRLQLSSLDHLAAKASQSVDVNIDERLIRIAAQVLSDNDTDEREVKKLVTNLKGIYVRSFEFDSEGQYTPADMEGIRTQLRAPGWSRLVNVTSRKEGTVEVYVLLNGQVIGGLAVLHADGKELTVVNLVGPVDLDKLAKLEGQLGIPEMGIESPKKNKNEDEK
jgi:Domain of unknown function (DUF4252)